MRLGGLGEVASFLPEAATLCGSLSLEFCLACSKNLLSSAQISQRYSPPVAFTLIRDSAKVFRHLVQIHHHSTISRDPLEACRQNAVLMKPPLP